MKHLRRWAVLGIFLPSIAWGQMLISSASASLPDAPTPADPLGQQPSSSSNVRPGPTAKAEKPKPVPLPCPVPAAATPVAAPAAPAASAAGAGVRASISSTSPAAGPASGVPSNSSVSSAISPVPCIPQPTGFFRRFLSVSAPDPMTVKQKAIQSGKDVIDPFNLITIGGLSALYVMQNAHSDYGPGMLGFSKNAGVSLTQNMTGEFFGTFVLPSIFHQDPRYHRMPHAKLSTRIGHVVIQTFVTQGDNGRPKFNYGNFPGFLIEDEISNLYVPMRHTNIQSTAARVSIGLATVPIGNAITEFLPDIARHINFNVVFLQRIINQVSGRDGTMNNQ